MDRRRLFSNFSLVVLGIILILTSIVFWYTKSATYFFWTILILGIIAAILGLVLALLPQKLGKTKVVKIITPVSTPSPKLPSKNVMDKISSIGVSPTCEAFKKAYGKTDHIDSMLAVVNFQ